MTSDIFRSISNYFNINSGVKCPGCPNKSSDNVAFVQSFLLSYSLHQLCKNCNNNGAQCDHFANVLPFIRF